MTQKTLDLVQILESWNFTVDYKNLGTKMVQFVVHFPNNLLRSKWNQLTVQDEHPRFIATPYMDNFSDDVDGYHKAEQWLRDIMEEYTEMFHIVLRRCEFTTGETGEELRQLI